MSFYSNILKLISIQDCYDKICEINQVMDFLKVFSFNIKYYIYIYKIYIYFIYIYIYIYIYALIKPETSS